MNEINIPSIKLNQPAVEPEIDTRKNSNIPTKHVVYFFAVMLFMTVTLVVFGVYKSSSSKKITEENNPTPSPVPSAALVASPSASPLVKPTPVKTKTPTPTVEPFPTSTPTPTPSPTPTPLPLTTPTPTPTPVPETPQFNISYPTSGQSIEMTTNQTLCVVEVPVSGNRDGLQVKRNINSQGWTSYASYGSYCFDPPNGNNKYEVQFKNQYNQETPIYSVEFTFQRI